jgi:hypothetical protein
MDARILSLDPKYGDPGDMPQKMADKLIENIEMGKL